MDKPTHRLSNTLDLVIHDADSSIIHRIKVDRLFSDHSIIFFDISLPQTITTSKVKVFRKLKNINPDAFTKDMGEFCLSKPMGPSLEDKVNFYHTMLQTTLDNHAPIKSHKCSDHPRIPWCNQEIAKAIRLCRCLERVWHRDKLNMEVLLFFMVNTNSCPAFWIKLSENSFSLPSLRSPQTTNASMRHVITYLADLKIHHCLLASLTKI